MCVRSSERNRSELFHTPTMKKILTIFSFSALCICSPLVAGNEKLDIGARMIGLGGAFTGLAASSNAVFWNTAGLGLLPYREASVFYARPYGLEELAYFTLTYNEPLPKNFGGIGFGARRYGFELYNETAFHLAYSNSVEKKFFYGIGVSHQSVSIMNYGSASTFGLDVGMLIMLTPELSIGLAGQNINRPRVGVSQEELAQTYSIGGAWRATSTLLMVCDVEKDVRFPLAVKVGMEFRPVSAISLRGGFTTEPSRFTGGVGVHYRHVDIDYAVASHQQLGITNQMSLSVRLGGAAGSPELAAKALEERIARLFDDETRLLRKGETINLNTASAKDLLRVPNLPKKMAERILQYRKEYGRFERLEELNDLRGMFAELYEKLIPYFTLD
jgi:competence ComEA-like helix-hairpin-helix protein